MVSYQKPYKKPEMKRLVVFLLTAITALFFIFFVSCSETVENQTSDKSGHSTLQSRFESQH
jgi:hypothetical protein